MRKQYGGDIQQDVDENTKQIQEIQQEIRDLNQRVQHLVPKEVREEDLLNFRDDYRPSQPSQLVTPTSQSAPIVDLLDAEPQYTGKTVDDPFEVTTIQQQTPSKPSVIEPNCRKISVADGSCKATPGCHPATPEEFKAYKKQQSPGTNMSKVKKPCLQGESPVLGGKRTNKRRNKKNNSKKNNRKNKNTNRKNNRKNNKKSKRN